MICNAAEKAQCSRVETDQLTLRGSVLKPEQVVAERKMSTAITLPTFISTWRARPDEAALSSDVPQPLHCLRVRFECLPVA